VPDGERSGVSGPIQSIKMTVVFNVLCKRNQCVVEMYPAWPIWSRDLTPSSQGTRPSLICLATGVLVLVAINKDGPGQCSGHLQAAQPRSCGPWRVYIKLFFVSHPVKLSFRTLSQMVICIVLIIVIFLGWINYIME
jgi:hypothetical protein